MKGSRDSERHSRRARLRPDMPVIYSELPAPSFAAEQLRTLAFQVDEAVQAAAADGGYALAVTSPDPGAGKTLTSLNLALTLAQEGERRVLLVETDLWKPSLSRYLELESQEPGLCQLIEEGGALRDATVPIWGAGLDLLPAGAQGRVGNLLAHRRMSELIAEMRSNYEVVVLDSPPFVLASGRALASAADGTLLVVRAGRTKKKAIEEVLSTLGPAKVVGMALNGTRGRNGGGYAYYAYGTPEEVAPEPELLGEGESEDDEQPPVERRRRAWVLGAGAALLLTVALGLLWLRSSAGPDEAARPEEARSSTAEAVATSASDLERVLGERIVEGARLAVAEEAEFDDSYVRIDYPGGDPGRQRGSGADLVVRAFRNAGIDLQQLVHEDIARAPGDYGITESDPSIDHRRTRNLHVFFRRNAITVPPDLNDWRPGDVVIWVTNRLEIPDRIGLISDRRATDLRPMVLYHFRADGTFSGKPGEGDLLTMWPIVAHYRWSLDSPRTAGADEPAAPPAAAPGRTSRPAPAAAAAKPPAAAAEPQPAAESPPQAAAEPQPAAEPPPQAAAEPQPAAESPPQAAAEPPAEAAAQQQPAAEPPAEAAAEEDAASTADAPPAAGDEEAAPAEAEPASPAASPPADSDETEAGDAAEPPPGGRLED